LDFPEKYRSADYVKWHHSREPGDKDLPDKIERLLTELKTKSGDDLKLLNELLNYFFDYAKTEYKTAKNEETTFGKADNVDFKEPSSIINKLWRNFRSKGKFIKFAEIQKEISDLIRTEVFGDTLTSCRFLAEKIKLENVGEKDLKEKCQKAISEISFEPEMKMASGYFAYHILFKFKSGIIVEVQIFSAIIQKWRKLSHRLYKIARNQSTDHKFGAKESRLVSLGHLFHLAECEIERLQDEFNEISRKEA
jgi:ppGpp synthetase/RelA/SpoT-type nucleotidyltranferase